MVSLNVCSNQHISIQGRECSHKKYASFISRSLHNMLTAPLSIFIAASKHFALRRKLKELELTNADVTFRLTLCEYKHERIINLKLAFLISWMTTRKRCIRFCPRIGAAQKRTQRKSLPRVSALGVGVHRVAYSGQVLA